MAMALEGIKVIDLTRLAPGPFCTMILGDFGADVIRVEEPGGGRLAREASGARDDSNDRRRAAFNAMNRNKRSIALNLKSPDAQRVLHTLCATADVFVEGFRPGVVSKLGCDYDTIKAVNDRLVYCSISGYGQDGPYRDLVGHDINYIGIGGALGVVGTTDGKPVVPYNIIADYAAGGMQGALGIMAALMARDKTGQGQYVDISMTDGVAYMMAAMASEYFREGTVPVPGAMMLNGGAPYYNVYRCKDGKYISVGCIEPWFWQRLCEALGLEQLVSHQKDESQFPQMLAALEKAFASRTRDEWWKYLRDFGDVAVGRVNSLDEVMADPQMMARSMIETVGNVNGEPVRHIGIGPKLSDTPGSVRRLGPTVGEHTDEILAELGFDNEAIAELMASGAIG